VSTPDRDLRTRTITWADPHATIDQAAGLSGLEYMRALASGQLPTAPMGELMGFTDAHAEEGAVTFWAQPGEHHLNPMGAVHGGMAATLLDTATGCAVHTTLPAGTGYATLELHVSFVRGIHADTGLVRCEGRVIHRGRTVATADAKLYADHDHKLLAHGTATCLLMPGPSPRA